MNLKSIHQLALTLPGNNTIDPPAGLDAKFSGPNASLASFISPMLEIILYIATFLAFYYLLWGAINYLMGQGGKENLAKARAKITWAIIGLIVIFLSFIIMRYFGAVFTPTKGGLPF